MMIKLFFKSGRIITTHGASCQLKECLESITAYFGNEDFFKYEIYQNDCKTLIWKGVKE